MKQSACGWPYWLCGTPSISRTTPLSYSRAALYFTDSCLAFSGSFLNKLNDFDFRLQKTPKTRTSLALHISTQEVES